MELERFHSLVLSLDMTLDTTKMGVGGKKVEPKKALKGRFASNQDYTDTFGPLVMEEVCVSVYVECPGCLIQKQRVCRVLVLFITGQMLTR